MDWLIFSLLAAASLAATAVLDKLLLSRFVTHAFHYLVALILLQQTFAAAILLFHGPGFTYPWSLYAIGLGVIQIGLWVSYLRALQVEEVSRVSSLALIYPLFVYAGSAAFLGEALSLRQYAGGLIIIASAVTISYRPRASRAGASPFSPALKYLLLFWLSAATFAIASKHLLLFMDELHLYMWSSIGNLLTILPLFADRDVRDGSLRFFRMGSLLLGAMALEEGFDFAARIFSIFAYARGPVSLVASIGALQPFITLVYVVVISRISKEALHEDIGASALSLKLAAVAMVALGLYLVY